MCREGALPLLFLSMGEELNDCRKGYIHSTKGSSIPTEDISIGQSRQKAKVWKFIR